MITVCSGNNWTETSKKNFQLIVYLQTNLPINCFNISQMSCYAKPLTADLEKDLEWNKDMLIKTSRSFALVINALGNELRDAVSFF
jgi:hypothetical protein